MLLAGLVQLRIDDVAAAAEGEALEDDATAHLQTYEIALLEEGHIVDGPTTLFRWQLAAALAARELGSLNGLHGIAGSNGQSSGGRSLARLIDGIASSSSGALHVVVVALVGIAGIVLRGG